MAFEPVQFGQVESRYEPEHGRKTVDAYTRIHSDASDKANEFRLRLFLGQFDELENRAPSVFRGFAERRERFDVDVRNVMSVRVVLTRVRRTPV